MEAVNGTYKYGVNMIDYMDPYVTHLDKKWYAHFSQNL